MRDFINPLNQILLENDDKPGEERKIDIVDFDTVCYGKTGVNSKRSLSLNHYKYEQLLTTCNSEAFTTESLEAALNDEKAPSVHDIRPPKKAARLSSFVLVVSICGFAMLTISTFKVFENSGKGKFYTSLH